MSTAVDISGRYPLGEQTEECENMKRKSKILGIVAMIWAMIGTLVTTVSATAIGDPYSIAGYNIGWVLLIGGVVLAAIIWFALDKKMWKKAFPVVGAMILIGALCFINVTEAPAEVTSPVTWSVSATADAGNVTIDDDARTITALCHINTTADTMLDDDDTAYTAPIINFTISPTQTEGLIDTALGATTLASVTNPDQYFTEDSTQYDLFADASGEDKKDLVWTADDTTEYETHYCTVNLGSSETVLLTIAFLDDGVSVCETGESESFTVNIGGITYTMTLIITGAVT